MAQAGTEKGECSLIASDSAAVEEPGDRGHSADASGERWRLAVWRGKDPAGSAFHLAGSLGEEGGKSLSIEGSVDFGIVIKINENVAPASPTLNPFRPRFQRPVAVTAHV